MENQKIIEAQEILKEFGLPEAQQNKVSSLTLLALCGITPQDEWQNATSKSKTISKDIIEFVNLYYDVDYKPNTRESFRKIALKPFVENNIVVLNPDNPELVSTSSKTHYALSEIALKAIRFYKTNNWENAIFEFKKNQFPNNIACELLLRKVIINNYKSVSNDHIELGRFNVFIGSNGCGKSNILEAFATIGASVANDLNFEGLYSRGVRIARPNLTISSFLGSAKKENIDFNLSIETKNGVENYDISLYPENTNDIYTSWRDSKHENGIDEEKFPEIILQIMKGIKIGTTLEKSELLEYINEELKSVTFRPKNNQFNAFLSNFVIFDLNTRSLRGVIPADSRKTPLGINGEGLDLLIANFNNYEKSYLEICSAFFDWLDSIFNDKNDKGSNNNLKPGRSSSTLYFVDKYMQKQNNTFSAENSNEGILHILFYIALFISNKTPNFFAIDNIETALNPRLCQKLIALLTELSKERGKQVIITTHNPAILDGLNLLDDEQRLFEVYREEDGRTKTRRIKFKKDLSDKSFKLSEMWLNGTLGAVPKHF